MNLSTKTTLPLGTIIKHTAYIYFDYQEAIITNTVKTIVSNEVGIKNPLKLNQLSIYPNPAQDYFTIVNPLKTALDFNKFIQTLSLPVSYLT